MKDVSVYYFDGKVTPLAQFIAPDSIRSVHSYNETTDIALRVIIKVTHQLYTYADKTAKFDHEKHFRTFRLNIGQTLIKHIHNGYVRYMIQPIEGLKDTEQVLKQ